MTSIEDATYRFGEPGAKRVVIVGAGIAGLSTALRLHRQGWDVLVVE